MQFSISYGESENVPEIKTEGNVYITNDTSQMYVDLSSDLRIQMGDLYLVESVPPSPLLLNKFYYNKSDSQLYFYNGAWNILNQINLTSEDITKVLKLGGGLKLDENVSLSVDVANVVENGNIKPVTSNAVAQALSSIDVDVNVVDKIEQNNMNPISSNAVYLAIVNIETALAAI